ncbi:uncharacterized protein [Aristolochia californica]|uniref:uncharacterized protein n=1 Tax=Aristolochia californica TaxID=171875 RepID=UPI0035DE4FAD
MVGPCRNPVMATWDPPPYDCTKLNFDGSALGYPGPVGAGGVFRDNNRPYSILCRVVGIADSNTVEVSVLLFGLQFFKERLYGKLIIEGDSKTVTSWCSKDSSPPWRHWPFTGYIAVIVSSIHCNRNLVPRSANSLPDKLAKFGTSQQSLIVWEGFPSCKQFV